MAPASDPERERVAALLAEHVGAGRLRLGEFDDRVAAAYAAQTIGDLSALLGSLPPVPEAEVDGSGRGWRNWAVTGAICLAVWIATCLAREAP